MTATAASDGEIRRFTTSDGYTHHFRHWFPASTPRGCFVWLHGIQSHSGWYTWSSRRFAEAGYDVRFLDRRGSGLNGVDRGHAPSADRLLDDVAEFLSITAADRSAAQTGCPVILAAVSWGAKLATAAATRVPESVDRLLLAYPAIRSYIEPKAWRTRAIRIAMRLGLGNRRVGVPLSDPQLFTDDADRQLSIRDDPLALHHVTFSFLSATLELTNRAEQSATAIAQPTLVLLAGRDKIVNTPAMREWAKMVRPELRTVIEFPDACHTLEFDRNRDEYVAAVLDWLESR